MTKIRKPYDPHKRVAYVSDKPSMTTQSAAKESDINLIMKKYEKTGLVSHLNSHQGRYGDYITKLEYHDAMNEIIRAQEMFADLPASTRARFQNDPAEFLAYAQNPDNIDGLVEMGLARKAPADLSGDTIPQPPDREGGVAPETPEGV